jgi:hypothetical protein
MDAISIAKLLANRAAGSFYSVTMKRRAKTFKTYTGGVIEKESTMTGILCLYANRAPVKTAVEDGIREEPELPSHIANSFKIGNVNFWAGKNGKTYLTLCAIGKPKVQWYLDGEPCAKSDVQEFLLASETSKPIDKDETEEKGQAVFFGIDVENILSVR